MDPLSSKSEGTQPSPENRPADRPKRSIPKTAKTPPSIPKPDNSLQTALSQKEEAFTSPTKKTTPKSENPFYTGSTAPKEWPAETPTAASRKKINPHEHTRTIPPSYYRRIARKFQKRFAFHCSVLVGFVLFLGLVLVIYGMTRWERSVIVEKVTQALSDLQADRLKEAQSQLEESLQLFTEYQPKPSVQQWSQNIQLYNYMLRAGMAFRSLGDYRKALDTYQQVASRNRKGIDTALGSELADQVKQLIDHERWSPDEMKGIYNYLRDMPPNSWSPCDTLLIVATEMAGLKILPMSERYEQAEIVTYGIPAPMQSLDDERFRVDGAQYYRVDRLPSPIEMIVPAELTPKDRRRLQWYSECGRACLVFGKNTDRGGVKLIGIEGVLLSDTHTVELFNRQVEKDAS